jgi:HK97 family phage portal protein
MTFWKRWFERRSVPTWSTSQSVEAFTSLFGEGPTSSTMVVTPETAVTVPAVFSCLQVLSQDVARTPIKLRRKVAEDTYVDAVEHDLYEILSALPNPETTAYQFKAGMMTNLLTYGRAYAQVTRVDGRVTALWALDPRYMRVDRDASRRKRWTYAAGGQTFTWTFDASMPPIFELVHDTPITRCRDLIGTALALQVFTGKFFANGGRLAGVLQASGAISQDTAARLRQFWQDTFGKPENAHKVAILDGGLEYKPFASDNESAQLNETLQAINTMIAGTFRVPTWKIGDLTKTSYANMEAGELAYVTSTLDPFFACWEDAVRRDLLTTRQYGTYTVTFDRAALLRSDVKAQHDALAQGIQAGIYSQNDARRMLGLNPIPDGDRYSVNSALVPISSAGESTHVVG